MVSTEGAVPVIEGVEPKSEPTEELKPAPIIEDTVAAEPVEMNASEPLDPEMPEDEDVVVAEMVERPEDTNGHHRKKARGRKADSNEAFANKLEVSET
jgi:hypothetical protein